jgi:hypothetical protein
MDDLFAFNFNGICPGLEMEMHVQSEGRVTQHRSKAYGVDLWKHMNRLTAAVSAVQEEEASEGPETRQNRSFALSPAFFFLMEVTALEKVRFDSGGRRRLRAY